MTAQIARHVLIITLWTSVLIFMFYSEIRLARIEQRFHQKAQTQGRN